MQLYCLNVFIGRSSLPTAFIFMANRTARTYKRVFQVIFDCLNGQMPESFMLDFEIAAKKGFTEVFEGVPIRFCLFHLGLSI